MASTSLNGPLQIVFANVEVPAASGHFLLFVDFFRILVIFCFGTYDFEVSAL